MPRSQPTLKGQERRMLFDVFNYFLKQNNITDSHKKTAEATNKSVSTVRRIIKESKKSDGVVAFRTPGKKRNSVRPVTGINSFDKGVIKRCIHNFLIENELPTLAKLRAKFRSDINFQGSEKSLRRIIKELGFKWKTTENNKKVLIEKSAIRLLRINYLQKLRQYRQQNRPIIYTDESYVHATHISETDGTTKGLKKPVSKTQRAVIVHAGSEAGFVPNALLTFKSGTESGDNRGVMNFETYEKWIRTQLLPNLPPKSILVLDNATYHNKEYDVAPNENTKKTDMQTWLSKHGIPFTPDMLKPQLYQLIKSNKDRFKTYSIDKILNEHGHDVLRLPPNHLDLNPIEMVWAAIKAYVSSNNIRCNAPYVVELIKEKVTAIRPCDWKRLCDKVRAIEEAYIKSDHVIDEMTDELGIRSGDSDSSDSEADSSTDTEGDVAPPSSSSGLIPLGDHMEVEFVKVESIKQEPAN
ncbi:uncharacterized protein LOC126368921 [Pectinophora gossypiella]|uniref:uncharacterized protein LOC126368921 n=1 Tax=Pectinophora gossypiella TaxID=13191 RepID=UPI00214ECEF5|nr:uncharacterized protein LOC126368921 [Pectinophora gossypiella]